ncbi:MULTISPECIES: hypothetical protein [Ruminococcus]|jgi:hypothetical protein|uniref:hypothetical protein n=1 Tax=Ruminococcus sp. TaxID=41978 RepID=UPI0015A15393|nr:MULTISPECIES: hypothetical protein [Ruminococcus]
MKWSFFPRNKRILDQLLNVITAFADNDQKIKSDTNTLVSDEVLKAVSESLENIGYTVEKSKKDKDKIKIPVLYGECGKPSLNFEADAFNYEHNIVIEVEAGRAVTNYQFLKDFFEACCMDSAEYLCIAVRLQYKTSADYKKVCDFFDAMYASNKFNVPLKGILIIGY